MVQGRRRFGTIGSYLVGLIALQIVLFGVLIGYGAIQDFRHARIDAISSMTTTAKAASHFVAEDMQSNVDSVATFPDLIKTLELAPICETLHKEENQPLDDRWSYSDAHMIREDGSSACAYRRSDPNVRGEAWFRQALASPDEPFQFGPTIDPISHQRAYFFIQYDSRDHLVVAIADRVATIATALEAQFGSATQPVSFFVTTGDRKTLLTDTEHGSLKIAGTRFARSAKRSNNTFADAHGKVRFWSDASVRDLGWHVFAGVTRKDAFAAANSNLRERIVLLVVFLLLVLVVAFVIQRRIARPINALRNATRSLTAGDFGAHVEPSGPVELSELADGFNTMVGVRADAETKLHKALAVEQHAADELREVDKMRNTFLMAISHELRTPLTSVVGFSSMLQSEREHMSDSDVSRCIDSVASQSKRLEKLLLDLLDIDRLSRGVLEPRRADTNVKELVRNAVERADRAGRVKTTYKGSSKGFVDPALCERIIENLVTNAIKYTPADSSIWVRATRNNGHFELVVDDSGPGVPDDVKEHVFELFHQGSQSDHVSGTGVGLALVKQFAKLQGGDAWVEDRDGGGASFRVVLPAQSKSKRQTKRAA